MPPQKRVNGNTVAAPAQEIKRDDSAEYAGNKRRNGGACNAHMKAKD